MFALLALITFILALFGASIAGLNLLILGLVFVAAHLLFGGWSPWSGWVVRSRQ